LFQFACEIIFAASVGFVLVEETAFGIGARGEGKGGSKVAGGEAVGTGFGDGVGEEDFVG
jgi:hypothetical protein